MASGRHLFVGMTDEPTWVRYEADERGRLQETGRISFLNLGATRIDYGNAFVDEQTIVTTTIVDPEALEVVGVAEDDRCASGGRIVFDEAGYGYVMGDGRNYSIQMFANAASEAPPENCLLRIASGQTDFDEDFFFSIPDLTGGLEAITEIETGVQGSGVAFAKMFYPDRLPDGVAPVDFDFWGETAQKKWRLVLGDQPIAEEVKDAPFSAIGFTGTSFGGKLYVGESADGVTSDVYEYAPDTNTARLRFSLDGYLYGLYELEVE